MYKILFLTRGGEDAKKDLRQTVGGKGISLCGKYQFYINEELDDPDFVVVKNKAIRSNTEFYVAPANTILLTSEPYSILGYSHKYCMQFGTVCSCQENLKLPNVVYTQAMLPWFVGIKSINGKREVTLNYEDLQQIEINKTKLISVITSNKAFTKGHQDRLDFVDKLKAYYGDKIDVFGHGFNEFEDKWDVLAPYKYHISIENSSSKHYWTEKLSDCFLAQSYPLYYGCTNIDEYFPNKSYSEINIHDFDQAVKVIDAAIAGNLYENRLEYLKQSRNLVLNEYNLFNNIVSICDKLDPNAAKKKVKIKPASSFFNAHNIYLYTVGRNLFKFRRFINRFLIKNR